jgi:hypothetical protein
MPVVEPKYDGELKSKVRDDPRYFVDGFIVKYAARSLGRCAENRGSA